MSSHESLMAQIVEATRALDLAAAEITRLRKQVTDLAEENVSLRIRAARLATHLRKLSEGEL